MTLSPIDVRRFARDGFISPLAALTPDEAHRLRAAVVEHLTGATAAERYELTDNVKVRDRATGPGRPDYEYFDEDPDPKLRELPFLFNLWKVDPRFWAVANTPRIVAYAQKLLGTEDILLLEDNVVVKTAGAKYVPWHQDYSYWPLGEPTAITVWIALDDIGPENGAMEVAPGTQLEGERLPVKFLDGSSFMGAERSGVPEVPSDPRQLGYDIVTYELSAGECGIHDALVWHGSTENRSEGLRCALVLRYVAAGTKWLGNSRIPYDDVGCDVGDGLTSEHFPAVGVDGDFTRRSQ
jgi:hypothetical protein